MTLADVETGIASVQFEGRIPTSANKVLRGIVKQRRNVYTFLSLSVTTSEANVLSRN